MSRTTKYPYRAQALDLEWTFEWTHSQDQYELGDAETEYPTEVLNCDLLDADGNYLESLCQIADPSTSYAREIENDLACEALARRAAAIEADKTAHTFQAL